ncbi:hypothetical protein GCM10025875_34770 [Litorihabitans aurantiacus]|uniref:Uncharacterized protein n=1 Tax=Litorihabitans aurantiacus TaxID=1930061 RepID=A0AA37UIY6_9MICO|nr:hypothetical protein GCM10025875_00320 [Litorihabitans aurantiacus]GMA33485.1 hypothetical protein GCM10025875_34770 [Litorihabitans aurantiacus]
MTDSPTARAPVHVSVVPVSSGASPVEAVGAPVRVAPVSTSDRSSVITTGSSAVAPVLVPVTVYVMVSPASTVEPETGLEALVISKPGTGCSVVTGAG